MNVSISLPFGGLDVDDDVLDSGIGGDQAVLDGMADAMAIGDGERGVDPHMDFDEETDAAFAHPTFLGVFDAGRRGG